MVVARRLGISKCTPRSASTLGLFSRYDGNIIGGAMLGCGMALTGACPGTVLVQVATGVKSGYFVLMGGLLGGTIYSNVKHLLRRPAPAGTNSTESPMTVFDRFDIKQSYAVLAYEAICLALVVAASRLATRPLDVLLHPVVGGLLISGGQAASLLMTGNAVGVSTVYEQVPQLSTWLWKSMFTKKGAKGPMPAVGSTVFATGIIVGSMILSQTMNVPSAATNVISIPRAILGGFVMVFGARLAGGCTSGHGISGMSTLSISSIITVASIFSGGIALASALR
jgi:uncharacterized membrane protein YedE/YeeE